MIESMPERLLDVLVIQEPIIDATSIPFLVYRDVVKTSSVRITRPVKPLRPTTITIASPLRDERRQFFGLRVEHQAVVPVPRVQYRLQFPSGYG